MSSRLFSALLPMCIAGLLWVAPTMAAEFTVIGRRKCRVMLWVAPTMAAEFTVERKPEGVVVRLDGKLFTEYLTRSPDKLVHIKSGNKPILWPIMGPNNELMTRHYPLDKVAGEERDHPHHRSLWFTHGLVNGMTFWDENKKGGGSIKHREFVEVAGGPTAKIVTLNDWVAADGKALCEDKRTFVFRAERGQRIIDVEVVLKAGKDPVTFGDTKEGAFGLRVPDSMRVDPGKSQLAKAQPHRGEIVNSEGLRNGAAWGQPASWVDYHGLVDGKLVGIAIMNHPTSFRYPTPWHVRTYGLFAANPFGLQGFNPKSTKGDLTLAPGESLTLRYRVLLHTGDERQGQVARSFDEYKTLYYATRDHQ